jgi:hypothetical protein
MKYTKNTLKKLEESLAESGYKVRYEKGSFKAAYCVLKTQKLVVINQFASLEGKINCLLDILKSLDSSIEIGLDEEKQAVE